MKVPENFYVVSGQKFEGRFDWLDVTFPKNKLRIPARLVRVSDRHDVALIKVDVPRALPEVKMYDSYEDSRSGDVITVMGYPGISPDGHVRTKSQDPFNPKAREVIVPDLTVSGGLLGKILRGEAIPDGGAAYDYQSEFGDGFQLTVNATGVGNSGGPVFDDHGRVIGIFFAGGGDSSTGHISFAVPIRFGMEIMEVKPVLK